METLRSRWRFRETFDQTVEQAENFDQLTPGSSPKSLFSEMKIENTKIEENGVA